MYVCVCVYVYIYIYIYMYPAPCTELLSLDCITKGRGSVILQNFENLPNTIVLHPRRLASSAVTGQERFKLYSFSIVSGTVSIQNKSKIFLSLWQMV